MPTTPTYVTSDAPNCSRIHQPIDKKKEDGEDLVSFILCAIHQTTQNGLEQQAVSKNIHQIQDGPQYLEALSKAIYRMCCLGIIDDFTQDYHFNKRFRIVTKRKQDGEYYNGLKRFLMRYYTEERAEVEMRKTQNDDYKDKWDTEMSGISLTNFVHQNSHQTQTRHPGYGEFLLWGYHKRKNWLETNEESERLHLLLLQLQICPWRIQKRKTMSPSHWPTIPTMAKPPHQWHSFKYLRVIDEDQTGVAHPKITSKHFCKVPRLIRRSLTDSNPALCLLTYSVCCSWKWGTTTTCKRNYTTISLKDTLNFTTALPTNLTFTKNGQIQRRTDPKWPVCSHSRWNNPTGELGTRRAEAIIHTEWISRFAKIYTLNKSKQNIMDKENKDLLIKLAELETKPARVDSAKFWAVKQRPMPKGYLRKNRQLCQHVAEKPTTAFRVSRNR